MNNDQIIVYDVSTHSRAKAAAGKLCAIPNGDRAVSTHSRAKAAAEVKKMIEKTYHLFQHTAARRRLPSVD